MRVIALELCVAIAVVLFVAMMVAAAWHRMRHPVESERRVAVLSDLIWAAVPWVMVVGGALPAIQMTLGHE